MGTADRAEAQAVAAYWIALVQRAPAEELARLAEPLDPDLVATIARIRAAQRYVQPEPAFVAWLEMDLMRAFLARRHGTVPLRPTRPAPTNDRAAGGAPSGVLPALPLGSPPRRWGVAQLATAALLLLTLGFGIRLLGPRWLGDPAARFIPAPALVATSAATPTAGPLLRLTLTAAWTRDIEWVGLARATYAPGGSTRDESAYSPQLYFIETGAFAVHSVTGPAPMRVATGATAPTATASASADLHLVAGDALLLPAGSTVDLHNAAQAPASLLWLFGNPGDSTLEANGMTSDTLDLVAVDRLTTGSTLPAPPIVVTLDRLVLAPGAALPAPAGGVLHAIGAVDAAVARQGGTLTTEGEGVIRNVGSAPLALYVVTAAPASSVLTAAAPSA